MLSKNYSEANTIFTPIITMVTGEKNDLHSLPGIT